MRRYKPVMNVKAGDSPEASYLRDARFQDGLADADLSTADEARYVLARVWPVTTEVLYDGPAEIVDVRTVRRPVPIPTDEAGATFRETFEFRRGDRWEMTSQEITIVEGREPMDDERAPMPEFTIVAKDALAVPILGAYERRCLEHGLVEQARQVRWAIEEFCLWQRAHIDETKLPDHEHVPARRAT